jgi:hypothetical protein
MFTIFSEKDFAQAFEVGADAVCLRKENLLTDEMHLYAKDCLISEDTQVRHSIKKMDGTSILSVYEYFYYADHEALCSMNTIFETNFVAVYRSKEFENRNVFDHRHIDFDCETFFVVTKSGKVLSFSNSEWGGVDVV